MIFQNVKTHFQAIKTRSLKSRKIDVFSRWLTHGFCPKIAIFHTFDIFPKGLSHAFGPKMAIFPTFFFQAIYARKMCFMIFQKEKTYFQGRKTKSRKSQKNGHFSKGVNPRFWSKTGHVSNFFFLGNIGQKNVLYDILKRKNAFLGYKNKKFKKSKN